MRVVAFLLHVYGLGAIHFRPFLFGSSNPLCPSIWGFLKDYLEIKAWVDCRVPSWTVRSSDLSPSIAKKQQQQQKDYLRFSSD
jgi:hypothetical protein